MGPNEKTYKGNFRLSARMKNNKLCVFVLKTLSESFLLISVADVTRVLIIGNLKNVTGYVLTPDPKAYK